MGAFTTKNIAQNTIEDGIDEGISNIVYAIGSCYFGDGAEKNPKCNDIVKSAFDEALEGAGNTLKYSIMNAVIYRTTEYAISKIIIGSGTIYLWIKKRRVVNSVKKAVTDGLGGIPIVGGFLSGAVKGGIELANGNQAENLALAQMANNNLNNLTTVISQERQNQILMRSSQNKQVMQSLKLNHDAKGLRDSKKINAYLFKMKTGTWTNTSEDKKLFQSVVPKEYIKEGFMYNSSFVDKLNKHTEYAKTVEGELMNLAQTNLDMITANNLSQVK